ncbi:ATP-binding protein [Streptomyces sp. NPDC057654]|uniref:sensor histidine kinase n=1 Tax=Streptomyces sp. NPDC057654 TaxID=3346196 RepID=UPI00367856EE
MKLRLRPRPRPSLRTVFAASFALVTTVVTGLVGFLSYDAAAHLVRVDQQSVFRQVVQDLRQQVTHKALFPADYVSGDPDHDGPRDDLIRPTRTVVQVLGAQGRIADTGQPTLPVSATDRALAENRRAGVVRFVGGEVEGDDYRQATVSLGGGRGAVQVAQQLSDTEDLLNDLQKRTVLFVAALIAASSIVGWWLARRITGRLVRLTGVAEGVAATGRVDMEVPVGGQDEVGRLGRAFDDMLGRLAHSEEDQRRLVQDAGHELRTPLTSLRTNLSTLRRYDQLPPHVRDELLSDLTDEARELTDLVNELVELAAGQGQAGDPVPVALGEAAERAAALARRRTGRTVTVRTAAPATVLAWPPAVQRAISNLLENAAKFDQDRADPLEIVVSGGRVDVRDRGPGLDEADLPHIFGRFYRASTARSLPGSGLGLAIVREVAAAHGGTVHAANRVGGGAEIGFTLPMTPPEHLSPPDPS